MANPTTDGDPEAARNRPTEADVLVPQRTSPTMANPTTDGDPEAARKRPTALLHRLSRRSSSSRRASYASSSRRASFASSSRRASYYDDVVDEEEEEEEASGGWSTGKDEDSVRPMAAARRRSSLISTPVKAGSGYAAGKDSRRRSSVLSIASSDVDISVKQDGPILLPDRESHTADLEAFDRFVDQLAEVERDESDNPFHAPFWDFLRDKLEEYGQPIGFGPHPLGPNKIVPKGPDDNLAFITKKFALDAFSPINPAAVATMAGIDFDIVLTELTYATTIGLTSVKFSPECVRCGGAVCEEDTLNGVVSKCTRRTSQSCTGAKRTMDCAGCTATNSIHSLDSITVVFFLHPEVLYVLAGGFGCKPSQAGIANCAMPIAVVPGTSTGSGFRYSVGCGGEKSLGDALPKGRYRMHCPIARTDNYLDVVGDAPNPEEKSNDDEEYHTLSLKVSDMQVDGGKKKTITVPHGAINFDITPDTSSLFALWVQHDTPDENTIFGLPSVERVPFTSAATAMNHPAFDRLLHDSARLFATRPSLEMGNVVLVFTDIVGSTDMYAKLGDARALELVDKHFEVLFGAFGNYGRVIKTIGDAVMASFPSGRAAIMGVASALANVSEECCLPDGERLRIRVGLHKGPAIVVPVNGINDYFGQTVNVAARVEAKAAASSCLVTQEVLSDPDAAAAYKDVLEDESAAFVATPEAQLALKGVQGSVRVRGFKLWEEEYRIPLYAGKD